MAYYTWQDAARPGAPGPRLEQYMHAGTEDSVTTYLRPVGQLAQLKLHVQDTFRQLS